MKLPPESIIKQYQEKVSDDLHGLPEILQTTSRWAVPAVASTDEAWRTLEQQIAPRHASAKYASGLKFAVAAAVTVMILSVAVYFFLHPSTKTITGTGEIAELTLPDGSQVTLNAQSKIRYDPETFAEHRVVMLEGEAFFEVKPGTPFDVRFDDMTVSVLGTSFNIYTRNGQSSVACFTGKVRVADGKRTQTLVAGRKISSTLGKLNKFTKSFVPPPTAGWTQGEFEFKNTPLRRVIKEIEIQYGVKVESRDFEDRMYTGFFDKKDLNKALKQVLAPMGYAFHISERTVIVTPPLH